MLEPEEMNPNPAEQSLDTPEEVTPVESQFVPETTTGHWGRNRLDLSKVNTAIDQVRVELSKVIVGQQEIIYLLITAMLAAQNLPNEFLTLEITESVVLQGGDNALKTLNALRQSGINISIDDYGTGFSTLDYLKRIPANEVKIDKSFTLGICEQGQDRILVGSTVEMAHMLGYKVVAEGVETPQTLLALSEIGCDIAQGYLIGHPVPLDHFIQLLVGRRRPQYG